MDIQVLNEIANQVRQASLSQVRPPVSTNPQLKALKGNPVFAQENPATQTLEESPDQTQDSVSPDISSVARAASTYSATVGQGLNSDELNAIRDLSEKVRVAVSNFLSQPGLEQAADAAEVVVSNPEAVGDLVVSLEQAVVEALGLQVEVDEVITDVTPPRTGSSEQIPDLENFVSIERITNGAELDNPVQVVDPGQMSDDSRASEPASEDVPESSSGDFRVTASGPALQNVPIVENSPTETPVDTVATAPQSVSVDRPETVTGNSEDTPVAVASPVSQDVPVGENTQVETPVNTVATTPQSVSVDRPETVTNNSEETPVPVASPVSQSVPAGENGQVQAQVNRTDTVPAREPVSRSETVVVDPPGVPQTDSSPVLRNVQEPNTEAGNPVNISVSSAGQEQGLVGNSSETVHPDAAIVPPEAADNPDVSGQSSPQPGPVQSNDLFAQENTVVNPDNIRDANELVNSVMDNEFTSEAKKIFSEPKVIRTVADLADFILERLQEIIAEKQLQRQFASSNEAGIL